MANKIKGLTVAIGADTSGVTKGLEAISAESIRLSNQLKSVNALLKLDPGNADIEKEQQKLLGDSIAVTTQKLEQLRAVQADVNQALANGSIDDAAYIAYQKELLNTEKRLRDLQAAQEAASGTNEQARTPLETLTQTIADQKGELAELRTAYQNAVLAEGEDSDAAQTLAAAYQNVDTALKANESSLAAAKSAADGLAAGESKVLTPLEQLRKSISDQKGELARLSDARKNAILTQGAESQSVKELDAQIGSLTAELDRNETQLASLDARTEDASADFDDAADKIGSIGNSAASAGEHLGTAAVAVGTFIGNLALDVLEKAADAIGALADGAIETGKQFDTGMSQIAATLGYTTAQLHGTDAASLAAQENMDMLREKALEMGAQTAFTATQAAEGLNILAMSGYSAEEATSMIGDVLNLAAAGGLSLADAAGYVSGAVKGFADETMTATNYVDLMAKGATLANTDVNALGEALSGGAATAAAYGQNADSLTLSLLRMAEQGSTGSEAATSLNRAMADLYTPTAEAKAALDALGVSAYNLDDGSTRDFNAVIDDLNQALSTMTEEQANAYKNTIFTTNGLNAFNKMTVTSNAKVNEWADALRTASPTLEHISEQLAASGIAWEQYADTAWMQNGGIESLTDQILYNLQEQKLTAAETAEFIASEYDLAMSDAEAAVASVSGAMDGSAAAQAATMLDNLEGSLTILGSAFEGLQMQLYDLFSGSLKTVVDDVTNGILPAISDIVNGVEGGGDALANAASGLVDDALGVLDDLQPAAESIAAGIGTALQTAAPRLMESGSALLLKLADGIVRSLPELTESAVPIVQNLADGILRLLPSVLQTGIALVTTLADGVADALPELLPAAVAAVAAIAQGVADSVPEITDAALALILGLADGLLGAIPALLGALPQIVDSLVTGLLGAIPEIIRAGITLLTALTDALPEIISQIVSVLPQIITAIELALMENVPQITAAGFDLMTALLDALPEIIAQVVTAIPLLVAAIGQSFTALYPQMQEYGLTLFTQMIARGEEIYKKFTDLIPTIIDRIAGAFMERYGEIQTMGVGIFDNVAAGIRSVLSGAWNWGSDLISNFVGGIRENIQSVIDAASDIATTVWEYLHFSEPEKGKLAQFHTFAPDMMQLFAKGIRDNAGLAAQALEQSLEGVSAPEITGSVSLQMPEVPELEASIVIPTPDVAPIEEQIERSLQIPEVPKPESSIAVPAMDVDLMAEQIERSLQMVTIPELEGSIVIPAPDVTPIAEQIERSLQLPEISGIRTALEGIPLSFQPVTPELPDVVADLPQNLRQLQSAGAQIPYSRTPLPEMFRPAPTPMQPVLNLSVTIGSVASDYDTMRMTDRMIEEISAGLAQLQLRQNAQTGG